ncbi:TPA: hypothetical protein ACWSXK_000815 [Escherichia coli]
MNRSYSPQHHLHHLHQWTGYRKAMRNIATGFDTGEWPAPITADYTDELNDFDLRRLEALRTQA